MHIAQKKPFYIEGILLFRNSIISRHVVYSHILYIVRNILYIMRNTHICCLFSEIQSHIWHVSIQTGNCHVVSTEIENCVNWNILRKYSDGKLAPCDNILRKYSFLLHSASPTNTFNRGESYFSYDFQKHKHFVWLSPSSMRCNFFVILSAYLKTWILKMIRAKEIGFGSFLHKVLLTLIPASAWGSNFLHACNPSFWIL